MTKYKEGGNLYEVRKNHHGIATSSAVDVNAGDIRNRLFHTSA
jgi:hypothetical protein